jgi:hypothetical protein
MKETRAYALRAYPLYRKHLLSRKGLVLRKEIIRKCVRLRALIHRPEDDEPEPPVQTVYPYRAREYHAPPNPFRRPW